MANIPTSGLNSLSNLDSGDLINISEDLGGGSFESRKMTAGNFDMVHGTRYYGVSATDPSSPSPQNGDEYYNSAIGIKMYYDGTRSKWLSVETETVHFGRDGSTLAGSYYRGIDGQALSATNGIIALENGTVIGIGYTRDDTDSATFEVTAGGTLITGAVLASTSLSGKTKNLNSNFSEDDILAVRNQSGGNSTTNVEGWVRLKWRI